MRNNEGSHEATSARAVIVLGTKRPEISRERFSGGGTRFSRARRDRDRIARTRTLLRGSTKDDPSLNESCARFSQGVRDKNRRLSLG